MPPPPPPTGPSCQLEGAGYYNGYNWNYRISVNGQVMAATDSFDGALQKLRTLVTNQICSVPNPRACIPTGAGYYNGYSWKYLLEVGGTKLFGTDSMDTLLARLNQLQQYRVCAPQFQQTRACTVSGAGYYNGYHWKYRLNLDGRPFDATDSLDTLINKANRLQQAGVCRNSPAGRCMLGGGGYYNGYNWNHIVRIENEPVDASDSLETAIGKMNQFRFAGFCY